MRKGEDALVVSLEEKFRYDEGGWKMEDMADDQSSRIQKK